MIVTNLADSRSIPIAARTLRLSDPEDVARVHGTHIGMATSTDGLRRTYSGVTEIPNGSGHQHQCGRSQGLPIQGLVLARCRRLEGVDRSALERCRMDIGSAGRAARLDMLQLSFELSR
jgi:hypothetical protein